MALQITVWQEEENMSDLQDYLLEWDGQVYNYHWHSYGEAMKRNTLRRIERQVYEKICEEISDEHSKGE